MFPTHRQLTVPDGAAGPPVAGRRRPRARAASGARFRPRRWGFLQIAPARYGMVRFRLVVLAPGSTHRDYAVLRFADASAWLGAGTWVGCVAVLGPALQRPGLHWLAVTAATALAVLVAGLVHHSATRVRRGAREAWVCTGLAPVSFGERAADLAAADAARLLRVADELRAENRIDAVEYELAWVRAWNLLPPRRRPWRDLGDAHRRDTVDLGTEA